MSIEIVKQMRLDVAIQMVLDDPALLDKVLGKENPKEKINAKVLRQLTKDNPRIKRVLEWYAEPKP